MKDNSENITFPSILDRWQFNFIQVVLYIKHAYMCRFVDFLSKDEINQLVWKPKEGHGLLTKLKCSI